MTDRTSREIGIISDIIYAAHQDILSRDTWVEILDLLNRLIPSDNLGVFIAGPDHQPPQLQLMRGLPDSFVPAYDEYYHKVDIVLARSRETKASIWRPTDLVPKEVLDSSEIYTDLMIPSGVTHSVAVVFRDELCEYGRIGFGRGACSEGYTEEHMRLLSILQRHFVQAFREARIRMEAGKSVELLTSGIEQYGRPVFMFEQDCTLLFMNDSARSFCEDQDGDVLGQIKKAVCGLIRGSALQSSRNLTFLNEMILGRKYIIEASPVICGGDDTPRWLAAIFDLTEHLRVAVRQSASAFRLTNREMDICEELMRGLSNREIAQKLYITEFTVKDHFKSIANKLEISNRTELAIRLLGY